MPKATCSECGSNDNVASRAGNGKLCNNCFNKNSKTPAIEDIKEEECEPTPAKATGRGTRKSTRSTRYKPKTPATAQKQSAPTQKQSAPRGRGRRSIFKRPPLKAPTATATVVTSDSVFYEGTYMQVGDIVSMIDMNGSTYYAQIRGFMTDEYCEKSAAVTWLLPTKASPPPEERFDPATYIIGPEEEVPRKLEFMSFIMHAPSDYYKTNSSPYPPTESELNNYTGFIWTTLEAKDRT